MSTIDNSFFVYLLGYEEDIYLKYKQLIDDLANVAYQLSSYVFNNYKDYDTEQEDTTHIFDVANFLRKYELLKQSGKYTTSKGLNLIINNKALNKTYEINDLEKQNKMEKEFGFFLVKDINEYYRVMKIALKFVRSFDTIRDLIHRNENIDSRNKLINSYLRNSSTSSQELGIFDVCEYKEGILKKKVNENGIYVIFEFSKELSYKNIEMYINGKRKKYNFINETTIEVGPFDVLDIDKINVSIVIDGKKIDCKNVRILSLR